MKKNPSHRTRRSESSWDRFWLVPHHSISRASRDTCCWLTAGSWAAGEDGAAGGKAGPWYRTGVGDGPPSKTSASSISPLPSSWGSQSQRMMGISQTAPPTFQPPQAVLSASSRRSCWPTGEEDVELTRWLSGGTASSSSSSSFRLCTSKMSTDEVGGALSASVCCFC